MINCKIPMRNLTKKTREFFNSQDAPMIVVFGIFLVLVVATLLGGNTKKEGPASASPATPQGIEIDSRQMEAATNLQLWNP